MHGLVSRRKGLPEVPDLDLNVLPPVLPQRRANVSVTKKARWAGIRGRIRNFCLHVAADCRPTGVPSCLAIAFFAPRRNIVKVGGVGEMGWAAILSGLAKDRAWNPDTK